MNAEFVKGRPVSNLPRYCVECRLSHQKEHAVLLLTVGIRAYGLCTQHAIDLTQLMKDARKERKMPKFTVTYTAIVESTMTFTVSARDADAAEQIATQRITDAQDEQKIVGKGEVESVEVDNIEVEEE